MCSAEVCGTASGAVNNRLGTSKSCSSLLPLAYSLQLVGDQVSHSRGSRNDSALVTVNLQAPACRTPPQRMPYVQQYVRR